MTTKTRFLLTGSLLVLFVGVGAGLVAYYTLPGLRNDGPGPAEVALVPENAALLAYANVQDVMLSEVRQKLTRLVTSSGIGRQGFENETGINIERDIDHVIAALVPAPADTRLPMSGVVLARGRFDQVRIETVMREHGAKVEDYRSRRLILGGPEGGQSFLAVSFVEPGLAVFGSTELVRAAIDRAEGGTSIRDNAEMMRLVTSLDGGNAWAVGRFDALISRAPLPAEVAGSIPPITWFSINAHINGGIRGALRVETRDEQSATQLRDLVKGLVALVRLQTPQQPELQRVLDSLQAGGTGTTVALGFDIPVSILEMIPAPAQAPPAVQP